MLHLTLTGQYAGKPICGAVRNDTDKYQHYQYTYTIDSLTDICPDCKRIYQELEQELSEE